LRLDAADREQRLASDRDDVASQGEGKERRLREAEFPRADEHDAVVDAALGELAEYAREPDLERQRDVIREDQRSGAGPAFATVDGDEIDAAIAARLQARELRPERQIADGRLDSDGETGRGGNGLDEVEHAVDVSERRVRRRADAVAIAR